MIEIIIGLVFGNAVEWFAHKYVLHGRKVPGVTGRRSPRPASMKFHWQHHKHVRLHGYHDDVYLSGYGRHNPRVFNEVNSLLFLCVLTTLALPFAPLFTLTTYYCAANYIYKHRRSHLNPEWGKRHLPWHYDHHMNSDQDANWCVTRPWFDYLMGTRVFGASAGFETEGFTETNPLAIPLPTWIEKPFNTIAHKLLPGTYQRLNQNNNNERAFNVSDTQIK